MAEPVKANAGAGLEACANCGRAIGKLEAAHVWNEQVVCADCHGKLAGATTPCGCPTATRKPRRPWSARPVSRTSPSRSAAGPRP